MDGYGDGPSYTKVARPNRTTRIEAAEGRYRISYTPNTKVALTPEKTRLSLTDDRSITLRCQRPGR